MDLRKYTPIRAEMNFAIMVAVERGLFLKWSHEGLPTEAFLDYDNLKAYDEKKPMKFQQVLLSLLFCGAGLIAGAAILCWENRAKLFSFKREIHLDYTPQYW